NTVIRVDLTGRELRRYGPPRSSESFALSPDGTALAMIIRGSGNDDVFLMDVENGRLDRFSFDVAEDETPVWSPDGRQVAYSSAPVGQQRHIFVKTAGTAEPPRRIYTGKRHLHLTSWSPDGRWIAFNEIAPRSSDVWALNVTDTTRLLPIATTAASEQD